MSADHKTCDACSEELRAMRTDLQKLLVNDFPHLGLAITRLEERMKLVLWVLGIVTISVIGNFFK